MAWAERCGAGAAARGMVALVVLLSACALRPQPAALVPHLPAAIPENVSPDQPRLGIGPFVDVRGRDSRVGHRPALRPTVLGVIREGENLTGDSAFSGDLAEQLRRDAGPEFAFG